MMSLALAFIIATGIHLATMALACRLAGVKVRELSLGYGPTLLTMGVVKVRPFLIGGHVRFKDSRAESLADTDRSDAFDALPLRVRLTIILSGCITLLALAMAVLGTSAATSFAFAFEQLALGALSPLGYAQDLLASGQSLASTAAPLVILAVVATKVAVFNLLPFPAANGGAALQEIAETNHLLRKWPHGLTVALSWTYVAFLVSWFVAILTRALG